MEKNYSFQENIALEPKRKTINFILNYSKSLKAVNFSKSAFLVNLN